VDIARARKPAGFGPIPADAHAATHGEGVSTARVASYQKHDAGIVLPDPDDRHVVAAAVASGATMIVTINVRDFPASALEPLKIIAKHPDDFLCALYDSQPETTCGAVRRLRGRLKHPPMSVAAYLEVLERQGLRGFVTRLRNQVGSCKQPRISLRPGVQPTLFESSVVVWSRPVHIICEWQKPTARSFSITRLCADGSQCSLGGGWRRFGARREGSWQGGQGMLWRGWGIHRFRLTKGK